MSIQCKYLLVLVLNDFVQRTADRVDKVDIGSWQQELLNVID